MRMGLYGLPCAGKTYILEAVRNVAILRGGIFFAEGMYFQMGCRFQTYDPKHEVFTRPATKNVILVDSVINTGRTLLNIFEEDMSVALSLIHI